MATTFRLLLCAHLLCANAYAQDQIQSTTERKGPIQLEESLHPEDGERGLKKRRDKTDLPSGDERSIPEFGPIDDIRVLPQLPSLDPKDQPISVLKTIKVKRIELADSTILPNELFSKIVVPFMNNADGISMDDLQQVRSLLSREYLDRGYINSGVIIPDQKIKNNTIILQSIEGTLVDVNVDGTKTLEKNYLKQRILSQVNSPLNINQLQGILKLLQQDPMIHTMGARLRPSETLGQAILDLNITENSPVSMHVGLNNYRSPSVGEENLYFSAKTYNLSGRGDTLGSKLGLSQGIKDFSVNYGLPVNDHQSLINTYLSATDSVIVEEPFDQIDIESLSTNIGFSYTHYHARTTSNNISSQYGLDLRHSKSTIFEQPLPSTGAEPDGSMDDTVLVSSLNWLERNTESVWAWNNTIRFGVDALGATINANGEPDGKFFIVQSNFQYTTRVKLMRSQLSFSMGLQLSNDSLLSLEKYSIGGIHSVRGYRQNQFVRDTGYRASVEWRFPLELSDQPLSMSLFTDYGSAKDKDEIISGTQKQTLSSVGFGLFWQPVTKLNVQFFAAHGITDLPGPEPTDKALQDNGIHLSVDYKI
jgi:hemolysin activation/secretion protein